MSSPRVASLVIAVLLGVLPRPVLGNVCQDDPDLDLCESDSEGTGGSGGTGGNGDNGGSGGNGGSDEVNGAARLSLSPQVAVSLVLASLGSSKYGAAATVIMAFASVMPSADAADAPVMTCSKVKEFYKDHQCCGNPSKTVGSMIVPDVTTRRGNNFCKNQKQLTVPGMNNLKCFKMAVRDAGDQSGADVTSGYTGGISSAVRPIATPYFKTQLCPVNVHWHLGAEHRSSGQYDEQGSSPVVAGSGGPATTGPARRLATAPRYGFACRHYSSSAAKFNTEYKWRYCKDMKVGATYEVHWPHSSLGACGTPYQYQSPFYDGVFCRATPEILGSLQPQDIANNVGVQGQVFTIVNDENYYYPELARGMIVDSQKNMGTDVATYVGSTTGTSRNNVNCSGYTPITWQVDRKCHLISASSFDKMCADMLQMRDDMTSDIHPHGARELVWKNLTAAYRGTISDR